MLTCSFELNNKPISSFWCASTPFAAFSGLTQHRNRWSSACIPEAGPIPPGEYYILDRQSGGLIGPLKDMFTGRDQWFALYAVDKKIDDEVLCMKVKRGLFRLHPKRVFGRSEGCIVIDKEPDFLLLRRIIKNASKFQIPGTSIEAYGRVVVR
jgi:hypothetical protein